MTFLLLIILPILGFNFYKNTLKEKQEGIVLGVTNTTPEYSSDKIEVFYGLPGLKDVQEMAQKSSFTLYPEDKYTAFPDPQWGQGSVVTVYRAMQVRVFDAKVESVYRTWQETVDGLLKEENIELLGKDTISPSSATPLSRDMQIKITRVAEVEVTEKDSIDYKTVKKEDIDLEKGQSRVERKGEKGVREKTYLIRREDGVQVSKKLLNSKVTKEPIEEILIVGIGPKYAKSGPYKDTINVAAKKYLINGTALQCLMLRESGGTANTGYPDNQYKGLFQYTEGAWQSLSAKAGYGGSSIYDAEAQIFTTAWALTHGQASRWPPWKGCSDK